MAAAGSSNSGVRTGFSDPNAIIVNERQKGNAVLERIRQVRWRFGPVEPDFVVGASTCVFFLSLRFHKLYPGYIRERFNTAATSASISASTRNCILLCVVDVADSYAILKELTVFSLQRDSTLLLAFSIDEAAKYLETLKAFENKPATMIDDQNAANDADDVEAQLAEAVCNVSVRGMPLSRTDCAALLRAFGTTQAAFNAEGDQLALVPGFGIHKAKTLERIFNAPLDS